MRFRSEKLSSRRSTNSLLMGLPALSLYDPDELRRRGRGEAFVTGPRVLLQ